jgi:hypothetical protein
MNHIEDLYQRINSLQEQVETIAKMVQIKRIKSQKSFNEGTGIMKNVASLAGGCCFFAGVLLIAGIIAGCATPPQVVLAPGKPELAAKLLGDWKGNWYADNGSSGRFEIQITSVEGDRVRAKGAWYNTVVGTAPFRVQCGFRDGSLWMPISEKYWFDLKLHEGPGDKPQLRGRYSTVGQGVVYQGDIRVVKQ